MLGRVRVAGHSMEPALRHGDELLFINVPPRIGSVVVARDPRDDDRLVVKRVAAIDHDDLILESDAPAHESLMVDRRAVLGRAILRYSPFFAGGFRPLPPPPSTTSVVRARAARRTRARGCC